MRIIYRKSTNFALGRKNIIDVENTEKIQWQNARIENIEVLRNTLQHFRQMHFVCAGLSFIQSDNETHNNTLKLFID